MPPGKRRRGASAGSDDESMSSVMDTRLPMKLQSSFTAVVKVFTSHAPVDMKQPWTRQGQVKSTASGFIISGRRILTNAHAVADATIVQVRKHGQPDRVPARVVGVSHCADVAVLTVDGLAGDAFFATAGTGAGASTAGSSELVLAATIPNLQDEVLTVGFPVGGDQLSVTSGVVSRISFGEYAHSGRDLLYAQVSSPINSGNSGGPVFDMRTSLVLGIAFQSLVNADGVGYIIPVPVVRHVLNELTRATNAIPRSMTSCILPDFPRLGLSYQDLTNPNLKAYLGVPATVAGVRVSKLAAPGLSSAGTHLQINDVITHCAGHALADDGTVSFRKDERLPFNTVLTELATGESVLIRLLRKGKAMEVKVPMEVIPNLVPMTAFDILPTYIVWAGFVLIHLTEPYLVSQYGKEWESKAPVRLVNLLYHGEATEPGESVVVMGEVLGHVLNAGYDSEDPIVGDVLRVVHTPDGRSLKATSLTVVAKALQEAVSLAGSHSSSGAGAGAVPPSTAVLRLEMSDNRMVVLPVIAAEAATSDVCKQHGIQHPMSADLRAALSSGHGASSSLRSPGSGAGSGADPHASKRRSTGAPEALQTSDTEEEGDSKAAKRSERSEKVPKRGARAKAQGASNEGGDLQQPAMLQNVLQPAQKKGKVVTTTSSVPPQNPGAKESSKADGSMRSLAPVPLPASKSNALKLLHMMT